MKFTLSWLQAHLDSTASLAEIVDKLTLIGLEVEALSDPSETFANFEVAEILATEPHPEADRGVETTVGTLPLEASFGDQAIGLDDVGNGCARDGAVSHP